MQRQRAAGRRPRSPSAPPASTRAVRDVADARRGPRRARSAEAAHHVRRRPTTSAISDAASATTSATSRLRATWPRSRASLQASCCGFFCALAWRHRRAHRNAARDARGQLEAPAAATRVTTPGSDGERRRRARAGRRASRIGAPATIRLSDGATRDSSPSASSTTSSTTTTGAAMRTPSTKTMPSMRATSGASRRRRSAADADRQRRRRTRPARGAARGAR